MSAKNKDPFLGGLNGKFQHDLVPRLRQHSAPLPTEL